jgi:hypothetical protein
MELPRLQSRPAGGAAADELIFWGDCWAKADILDARLRPSRRPQPSFSLEGCEGRGE